MSSEPEFKDDFSSRYDYADEFVVVCPKCSGKAKVIPAVKWTASELHSVERKVVCEHCSYWNTKTPDNGIAMYADRDWFFHLPLYYTVETNQGTLCAYNEKHLDFLESFISAKVRSRSQSESSGWSNRSQISRLPKWAKLAKNRVALVAAIKKLKNKS
jgi:hypothetical protein